jgi:acyl carrier protein
LSRFAGLPDTDAEGSLGTHSLMKAEVHVQLQQLLGREISLVDLFQFPTLSALAAHLGAPQATSRAERRLAARRQRK